MAKAKTKRERTAPPKRQPGKREDPRAKLSYGDRAKIHAHTLCSYDTIARWESGESVTSATKQRIEDACQALRIAVNA
jgi:hypothetical protein